MVVAVIVVVVKPGLKGVGALVVAGEGLPVGPFGLQGAAEPLDLAVLPGAVGTDQSMSCSEVVEDVLEVAGPDVVLGVVGHDLPHGDAVTGEEGCCSCQEAGAGRSLLVRVDLGVGQT